MIEDSLSLLRVLVSLLFGPLLMLLMIALEGGRWTSCCLTCFDSLVILGSSARLASACLRLDHRLNDH
jgi:hypothetical protein